MYTVVQLGWMQEHGMYGCSDEESWERLIGWISCFPSSSKDVSITTISSMK